AETVPSRQRARRPGLHHNRRCPDDAWKRSFCRKLRGMSFEQTTAAKYRSTQRRRKSMVPRRGHGTRFPGEQFSVERQALSVNEDRDEFGARIRNQRQDGSRLGQLLLADLQGALARGRTRVF